MKTPESPSELIPDWLWWVLEKFHTPLYWAAALADWFWEHVWEWLWKGHKEDWQEYEEERYSRPTTKSDN